MIVFSDEEGRFGGLLGSQAVAGSLNPEQILQARDLSGASRAEAMSSHGLDPLGALAARRDPQTITAFGEVHIQQGPGWTKSRHLHWGDGGDHGTL
jgi:beta-ureidopropionase / N-carbamoyl-L-amino-acid hydrolase